MRTHRTAMVSVAFAAILATWLVMPAHAQAESPDSSTTTAATESVGSSGDEPDASTVTDESASEAESEASADEPGGLDEPTSPVAAVDDSAHGPAVVGESELDGRFSTAVRPAVSGTGTNTTTTGQTLNISIEVTNNGDGTADVVGSVSIGLLSASVNVVFVLDVSGSTTSPAGDCDGNGVVDAADDFNGDLAIGDVMDCEIAGALTINEQLKGINGVQSGVVSFASGSTIVQGFAAPSDPLIESALRSLDSGGGTSFDAALTSVGTLFGTAPAGAAKIVYFFSDGFGTLGTGAGSSLQAAVAAGIQVNTFSVGTGATGCAPGSGLRTIADLTGGVCIEVIDPTQLASVLGNLSPAGIDHVTLRLNDGSEIQVPLDLLGNFKVTLEGLTIGADNVVVATVTASDGTTASATAVLPDDSASGVAGVADGTGEVAPVAVQTATGQLPVTGSNVVGLVAVGAALIMLGALAHVLSRRTRVA